jgi:DNA-binding MarR family transcriptional regulator
MGMIKRRPEVRVPAARLPGDIDSRLSVRVYDVMSPMSPSPAGAALTELVLEIFRLNGALLAQGDRLVGDIGLTSARWQVIGAAALSPVPLPVAAIARNMGLTRQAVQRVANDLEQVGFVRFAPNPHHQRAKLVVLTASGTAAYRAAVARQVPWANRIAAGLDPRRIKAARTILRTIAQRLDGGDTQERKEQRK